MSNMDLPPRSAIPTPTDESVRELVRGERRARISRSVERRAPAVGKVLVSCALGACMVAAAALIGRAEDAIRSK